jgi:cyclo(L-tyrosyl-L-tyrosyl) synthase
MVDTPAVLGVGSSVFCLDEPVPFVEELFHGKFAWQPNPRQGCVLLTPSEDADR